MTIINRMLYTYYRILIIVCFNKKKLNNFYFDFNIDFMITKIKDFGFKLLRNFEIMVSKNIVLQVLIDIYLLLLISALYIVLQ